MFERILIANRGEIACRIMRTAERMGIETVAVYSEADVGSMHVAMADAAYMIGPADPDLSYLNIEAILDAAERSGAEAIHPGYGFLSENAEFARAVEEAGLVFIGPSSDVIRKMGRKDSAKEIMTQAKIPVVPGYYGQSQDPKILIEQAEIIGFPVLVKPSAGGGGKGMQVVHTINELKDAIVSSKRAAKAAFGDDHLMLEKFITRPRHIEVQVLADLHGNVLHLFERECSIQRRHQKILEEAPAPNLSENRRYEMAQAAIAAARAVNYTGAGTVEFLVDDFASIRRRSLELVSSGGKKPRAKPAEVIEPVESGNFYFMEMNTRLQVEHPVTEMVVNLDLVEWQIRIADGEALPYAQEDIVCEGNAMEARIYAEDVRAGFLPATGVLRHLRLPYDRPDILIDTGVQEGDEITIHYDPMISKITAWGQDRESAIRTLELALTEVQAAGVKNNIDLLIQVLRNESFINEEIDTAFIPQNLDTLIPPIQEVPDDVLALASLSILVQRIRASMNRLPFSNEPNSPWDYKIGWRLNGIDDFDRLIFFDGLRDVEVGINLRDEVVEIQLPSGMIEARAELGPDNEVIAVIDGTRTRATVVQQPGRHGGSEMNIYYQGERYDLLLKDLYHADKRTERAEDHLYAPMPGRVVKVLVKKGQHVRQGDALMTLEAMKMEHTIRAPRDGKVKDVYFKTGDQVQENIDLLEFEES